jgi:hypothetical protein
MNIYINDGRFNRFVARDKANRKVFYRATQGGLRGDTVDYVRVDQTLNVTIHKIVKMYEDGSFDYNPEILDLKVTWS